MRVKLSKWAMMPNNMPRTFGRLRRCVMEIPDEAARVLMHEGLLEPEDGPVRVLAEATPIPPRADAHATPEPAKSAPVATMGSRTRRVARQHYEDITEIVGDVPDETEIVEVA